MNDINDDGIIVCFVGKTRFTAKWIAYTRPRRIDTWIGVGHTKRSCMLMHICISLIIIDTLDWHILGLLSMCTHVTMKSRRMSLVAIIIVLSHDTNRSESKAADL